MSSLNLDPDNVKWDDSSSSCIDRNFTAMMVSSGGDGGDLLVVTALDDCSTDLLGRAYRICKDLFFSWGSIHSLCTGYVKMWANDWTYTRLYQSCCMVLGTGTWFWLMCDCGVLDSVSNKNDIMNTYRYAHTLPGRENLQHICTYSWVWVRSCTMCKWRRCSMKTL